MLPTDRRPVVPRVRNLDQERLSAPLESGPHLLHDHPVAVLVELIDQDVVRPGSALAPVLRRHGSKERARGQIGNVVLANVERLIEIRRVARHPNRMVQDDRGLPAVERGRVDLGAVLVVEPEAIQAQTRQVGLLPLPLPVSI